MRTRHHLLSLVICSSVIGVTGCNSNLAKYPDPSESMDVVAHQHVYTEKDNLWDRLRDGMTLEIPHESRVDAFIESYTRRPQRFDRMQANAEPYLYHIVEELEARNLPLELALLPGIESNFTPTAVSRAGAVGMWQFIDSTGRKYGLKNNAWIDERRNALSATKAALDYLEFLNERFNGDWELSLAAYNAGEGAVDRARDANAAKGLPTDYWSLDLPRETEEYVPRFLAMASIVKHPERHHISFAYLPNRPQLAQIETKRTVSLEQAAERCGLDKKEFCKLNAAYLGAVTTSKSTHMLLVPADKAEEMTQVVANLPEVKPTLKHANAAAVAYTVRKGDTLSTISRRFGVSSERIRRANGLRSDLIRVGQRLTIKGGSTRTAALKKASGKKKLYRVKSGDTLWSIAQSHSVTVDALCRHNDLAKNSLLKPGQKLKIPSLRTASADKTRKS
jgi:membrane-bound lytic murein transglycosylase D